MGNKQTPKIRFAGFTGDWEQRSLSELGNLNRGKSKHRPRNDKRLYGGKYPFVQTGDVASAGLYIDAYTQTYNEFGIQQSKLWNEDTLLITIAANIAESTILKIKAAFPDSIIGFETIENNVVFIKFALDRISDNLRSKAETSSQANLNLAKLSNIDFYIPSRMEQDLVSKFFKQLDHLITLHQRELTTLKQTKQGFLQKMFPREGESVPEVRFPGFTGDWEQRKAKDLFTPIVEKGHEKLPVLSVTQEFGVVYRDEVGIDIKYDPSTLKDYKVIHPGDFVISLRSFQGGFELSDKLGITSPAYTIFKPKETNEHDNLFWKTLFKTFKFIESLKTVTFGIRDGKSISFSEFGDLTLFFPSNKDEQAKIGECFRNLDNLITLHQRELDTLKETKRAFLQKMFI